MEENSVSAETRVIWIKVQVSEQHNRFYTRIHNLFDSLFFFFFFLAHLTLNFFFQIIFKMKIKKEVIFYRNSRHDVR